MGRFSYVVVSVYIGLVRVVLRAAKFPPELHSVYKCFSVKNAKKLLSIVIYGFLVLKHASFRKFLNRCTLLILENISSFPINYLENSFNLKSI